MCPLVHSVKNDWGFYAGCVKLFSDDATVVDVAFMVRGSKRWTRGGASVAVRSQAGPGTELLVAEVPPMMLPTICGENEREAGFGGDLGTARGGPGDTTRVGVAIGPVSSGFKLAGWAKRGSGSRRTSATDASRLAARQFAAASRRRSGSTRPVRRKWRGCVKCLASAGSRVARGHAALTAVVRRLA